MAQIAYEGGEMKNKALEKKYSGDDLVFAKNIRNRIKRGKMPSYTLDRSVIVHKNLKRRYKRTVTKILSTIDIMVSARGL